jgi:CheY-like chemotaxis protein
VQGLAVVRDVVAQHHGHLHIRSVPGQGTSVKLYLPAAVPAQLAQLQLLPEQRGTETVLAVEDEASVRRVLSRILRQLGYAVLEAADGDDALRLDDEDGRHVDLLITDVVMPRLGGRQLAERMRARNPDLRVLFLSGYGTEALANRGVSSEDDHVLRKPFSASGLASSVRQVLDAPLA